MKEIDWVPEGIKKEQILKELIISSPNNANLNVQKQQQKRNRIGVNFLKT